MSTKLCDTATDKVSSIPNHVSSLHSLPPALCIGHLDHCPDPYAAGSALPRTTALLRMCTKLGDSPSSTYRYTHFLFSAWWWVWSKPRTGFSSYNPGNVCAEVVHYIFYASMYTPSPHPLVSQARPFPFHSMPREACRYWTWLVL